MAVQRPADEVGLRFNIGRAANQSVTEMNSDELRARFRAFEVRMLFQRHEDKPIQGLFYMNVERHGLSKDLTFSSLGSSETEGVIMAGQDALL